MNYCSNCGAPLEPETIFCANCGTRIGSGASFDAQKQHSEFSLFFSQAIGILFGMLRSPATTVSTLAVTPLKEGSLVFAGIMVVVQGLLGLWATSSIASSLYQLFVPYDDLTIFSSYSNMSIFCYALVGSITLLLGLYAGSVLAVRYLFKINCQSLQLWNIAAASKVPTSATFLIAIIFSYIAPVIVPLIFLLGGMFAFSIVVDGIREAGLWQKDKSGLAGLVSYAVMYLVAFIVFKLLIGNIY